METIEKNLVPESKRSGFLPRHVGKAFFFFENAVYDWMGQLCPEYQGGYWQFYELSSGGFFMAFDSEQPLKVTFPQNYFEEMMTPEAASIAANLFALNSLCWKTESQQLIDAYYALRDFAASHQEGAKILRVID